ncbi:MAG: hypothetical protein K0S33_1110 [Bacteroidetes bacterium]|jgi:hypothetical protein|nr:hypothetical protein [Bacteroidota bacterium]
MSFCNTIDRLIGTNRKRSLVDGYSFSIYAKAQSLPDEEWEEANGQANFFLSKKYLQTLEILHEDFISFRYILVYKNEQPILATYFQINDFTADVFGELLQEQLQEIQSRRAKIFEQYLDHNKSRVIMRLVTNGNNFVSGEHAFVFHKSLSRTKAFDLAEEVTDVIGKSVKLRGKISATLVKDFNESQVPAASAFKDKFIEFSVEPNMEIRIPEGIHSLTEYVGSFSKKYRNRAKNIFKANTGIQKRELDLADIQKHNPVIYRLYEHVFEKAKFKLVKLSYDYFTEMKRRFEKEFIVHGYFRENELIAFGSAYVLEDTVEAHFIGFDYELNKELESYQNLLYNFIELTIEKKKKILQLGRTASEIKSTVGAKAEPLVCYIHPQNTVSKLILKPFISFLQPSEWVPRNPFKEEAETT